jgi:hypothetical protein
LEEKLKILLENKDEPISYVPDPYNAALFGEKIKALYHSEKHHILDNYFKN